MKTQRSIFPSRALLAALLTAITPAAIAQTVDTAKRTATDSARPLNDAPLPNPNPAQLSAVIQPTDPTFTTSGEVSFTLVGETVKMNGRIGGLETSKRYQAVIRVPQSPVANGKPTPAPAANPSPQTAAPDAAPLPGPNATPPVTSPVPTPGAPAKTDAAGTAASSATSPSAVVAANGSAASELELDLGMITSDAQGIANLVGGLTNKDLGPPPNGIQGCTLIIKRAPPLDSREERTPVGTGMIVATGVPVPAPAVR